LALCLEVGSGKRKPEWIAEMLAPPKTDVPPDTPFQATLCSSQKYAIHIRLNNPLIFNSSKIHNSHVSDFKI
jgi:hypothetical protein